MSEQLYTPVMLSSMACAAMVPAVRKHRAVPMSVAVSHSQAPRDMANGHSDTRAQESDEGIRWRRARLEEVTLSFWGVDSMARADMVLALRKLCELPISVAVFHLLANVNVELAHGVSHQ